MRETKRETERGRNRKGETDKGTESPEGETKREKNRLEEETERGRNREGETDSGTDSLEGERERNREKYRDREGNSFE